MLVQSLDHWPIFPTAVRYALGFFHTQCGRSTSQSRLPKPELDLTITLSGYTNILKRNFLFLFFYKGSFHPYFKAVRLSLLTCTPLLILYNMYIKLVVRLACVKHLDSVHSEPSSNSIFVIFVIIFLITFYVFFFFHLIFEFLIHSKMLGTIGDPQGPPGSLLWSSNWKGIIPYQVPSHLVR